MNFQKTPIDICNYWKAVLPGCYDRLTELRDRARNVMGVSAECDLPLHITIAYLNGERNYPRRSSVEAAPDLTAAYIWRKHKIIYDFDKTLAEELCSQSDDLTEDSELPVDVLLHPPYPCVYIRSDIPTEGVYECDGFWAWIEVDAETNVKELRIRFIEKTFSKTYTSVLELTKPTLGECIEDTNRTRMRNHPDLYSEEKLRDITYLDKVMFRAMQLYLYICSDQADVRDNLAQKKIYRPRAKGQPIKDKFREIDMKDVGVVIGHTLRRAEQESSAPQSNPSTDETKQGSHKRPHTRRGHWHHYWTGPKSEPEQRKLILKWTHPILVGGYTDNVVTMFPVKE